MSRSPEETIDGRDLFLDVSRVDDTLVVSRDGDSPEAKTSAEAEPAVGSEIGRYMVLSKLGEGAMGLVLAAYDPQLDRRVALKLLRARGKKREVARARLQREAQVLAKLNHPNVVGVHDVGIHEERVFVAMEFVDGQTLSEWSDTAERSWREVLVVFEAAGRGLAAAHKQGLIHRDFKPENVMIGIDGRVRVMDFGLARLDDEQSVRAIDIKQMASQLSVLETPLTQTGVVLGTPAYMAPEQFTGMEVTAKSDQFGYCISLFEALHGERPFVGTKLADLVSEVTQGNIREIPRGSEVPLWLKKVLIKGLSFCPEERYLDMDALLAAFGAGEARRRRTFVAGVFASVGVVVVTALGVQEWEAAQKVRACVAQGAVIDTIWNRPVRENLRDGLMATGLVYAETVADKVMPWLGKQAMGWRLATVRACTRASIDQSWDPATHDKATWCLEERRLQLASLVTGMAAADEKMVGGAVRAAAGLESLAPCTDPLSLLRMVAPPPPESRAQVTKVRELLSEANYFQDARDYEQALALAHEARLSAVALGWLPILAAAGAKEAKLLRRKGRLKEGEEVGRAAYWTATGAGDWHRASVIANELAYVVGSKLARPGEGHIWAEQAEMARTHSGDPLGLREASNLNNLASILYGEARYAEAVRLNLWALELREGALGHNHPIIASSWEQLGEALRRSGDLVQAGEAHRRALAIRELTLGPDHPRVGRSIANLGVLLHDQGLHDEALELLERSLKIKLASQGASHPDVAEHLSHIAMVLYAQGKTREGMAVSQRSLAIWEQRSQSDHLSAAGPHVGLGRSYAELGDYNKALYHLERALEIRSGSGGLPDSVARSRFALAQSLWEAPKASGRDRTRARELAIHARREFARVGSKARSRLDRVDAWLLKHPEGRG